MNYNKFFMSLALILSALFIISCNQFSLFSPKGPIAEEEILLIKIAFGLMLIVVVPVFILAFWFTIRYRASNANTSYKPKWANSIEIEWAIWLVPLAIIIALSYLTWRKTYQLDPYKPIIASHEKTVDIEVVSLDWAWLFIYPDFNIATLNELVFPAKAPLSFRLTSATVMTSFFIPPLGSQMYAMAGMQTRLHLMADETGTFDGQNQEFSGLGYENMHFKAIATHPNQFKAWINTVKQSTDTLDLVKYEQLNKPNANHPVTYFSSVDSGLFNHILSKYR